MKNKLLKEEKKELEDFSDECDSAAKAPDGWTKWVIPGFEYLYVECDSDTIFTDMIQYLNDCKLSLAGAVHDFTCPQTRKNYMFFPIRKL